MCGLGHLHVLFGLILPPVYQTAILRRHALKLMFLMLHTYFTLSTKNTLGHSGVTSSYCHVPDPHPYTPTHPTGSAVPVACGLRLFQALGVEVRLSVEALVLWKLLGVRRSSAVKQGPGEDMFIQNTSGQKHGTQINEQGTGLDDQRNYCPPEDP